MLRCMGDVVHMDLGSCGVSLWHLTVSFFCVWVHPHAQIVCMRCDAVSFAPKCLFLELTLLDFGLPIKSDKKAGHGCCVVQESVFRFFPFFQEDFKDMTKTMSANKVQMLKCCFANCSRLNAGATLIS